MARNADIDDVLKEIKIKHYSKLSKYTEPEFRLLVIMSATMLQLDGFNRKTELLEDHLSVTLEKQEVNELEKKYSDL